MTNNNWETINEIIDVALTKYSAQYGSPDFMNAIKEITDEISNLLTKKDQEHKAELEIIKGELEQISKKQFIAATDNDGHRYQIPKNKLQDWLQWSEIPSDDERSWDVPDYAERIDGMNVKTPSLKDSLSILDKHINK